MAASRYRDALVDPFAMSVRGSKIPDMYAFPSDTYTVEAEYTVSADASGNFDFAVCPHPLAAVFTNKTSNITGAPSVWCANGSDQALLAAVNIGTFASKVDQYRLVSAAAKFESLLIPTEATGTLTVAHLPAKVHTVAQNADIEGDINDFLALPGTDTDGYFDKVMRVMPTGHAMNVTEWQGQGLSSCLRIISPEALDFRRGTNNITYNGTDDLNQADILSGSVQTSGTVVATAASPATTIGTNYTVAVTSVDPAIQAGDILIINTTQAGILTTVTSSQFTFTAAVTASAGNLWQAGNTVTIRFLRNSQRLPGQLSTSEYLLQGGWTNFCLRGAGFPSSKKAGTLRVVYNLETVDRDLNSSTFLGGQPSPVDLIGFNLVLTQVQGLPFYRSVSQRYSPEELSAKRLGYM